jgi:hypothetical protein
MYSKSLNDSDGGADADAAQLARLYRYHRTNPKQRETTTSAVSVLVIF